MATQAVFIGVLVSFFVTRPWAGVDVSVVSWCSLGGYIWRSSQRSALRLHRSARIWYLLKWNYPNFSCIIPNFLSWSDLNLARMASVLMNSFFWENAHFSWHGPQTNLLEKLLIFRDCHRVSTDIFWLKNVKLVTRGSNWPALIQKCYFSNAGP